MSDSPRPVFTAATIESILARLFPHGTRGTPDRPAEIHEFPLIPSDLFAAAAYLLEHGDAYHRIAPIGGLRAPSQGAIRIRPQQHARWVRIGRSWRDMFRAGLSNAERIAMSRRVYRALQGYWDILIRHASLDLVGDFSSSTRLCLWRTTFALLIIADEACEDSGFVEHPRHWFSFVTTAQRQSGGLTRPLGSARSSHHQYVGRMDTITVLVDPYVARVLPKSRTPTVGCTMRTLSHNAALLPPRGSVALNWQHTMVEPATDDEILNLLLIPFPYRIPARAFSPCVTNRRDQYDHWDWFELQQIWLPKNPKAFSDFVASLVRQAQNDCETVHGIILPELALDWRTHAALVDRIRKEMPDIEYLVSGCAQSPECRSGNFVVTTRFHTLKGKRYSVTYARAKHHRWRIDESQNNEYNLGSALDPHKLWWEAADINEREVGLTVFRKNSVFTVMVCEDLARNDPCHLPLQAVGPNLVFVLLMDGPQLPGRWPGRYAMTLADDPGSSVLTLTSMGLIQRANDIGHRPPSRAIALWKDDINSARTLSLAPGALAMTITLSAKRASEATLDGRRITHAPAWRYHGHQPVKIAKIPSWV